MTDKQPDTTAIAKPGPAQPNALTPAQFFNPRNLAEAMQLARELAKSDIVPVSFKGKPENILVAIGMGQEVGLNPFQALQSVAVINGRPSLWGDAVIGIVQQSGLAEYIDETYDAKTQTATCRTKRKGDPIEVVRSFSMADAKQAGLIGKDNWKSYPVRMCQMRARAWALRDKYADLLKGIKIREEVEDYETTAEAIDEPLRRSEIAASSSTVGSTPKAETISEEERKELADLMVDKGVTPDQMRKWLKDKFGVDSSKELPKDKLQAFRSLLVNGDEPEGA